MAVELNTLYFFRFVLQRRLDAPHVHGRCGKNIALNTISRPQFGGIFQSQV